MAKGAKSDNKAASTSGSSGAVEKESFLAAIKRNAFSPDNLNLALPALAFGTAIFLFREFGWWFKTM